jgi:hypothetical protein
MATFDSPSSKSFADATPVLDGCTFLHICVLYQAEGFINLTGLETCQV